MASKIPIDCLREIFLHIEYDSHINRIHDLHSCLLVNRTWCNVSVPILWNNPVGISWENNYDDNIEKLFYLYNDEFWEKFSRITFSCLPIESKKLIKKNNIKLNIQISSDYYTTFNYVGYIQYLSYRIISRCIQEIIFDNNNINDDGYNENLLENEIWKMFMNKNSRIKYLEPTNISIYYFPGGINCLENLVELKCSTNISSKFYFDLAQFCRNIKRMNIKIDSLDFEKENSGLLSLIELQNGLKEIRFTSLNKTFFKLGEVLIKHANTLTSLYFINFICIPIDTLNQLLNLKILNVNFPYGYCFKLLNYINLPKLEILEIQGGNGKNSDDLLDLSLFLKYSQLIEKTHGTIREIFVDIDAWLEDENDIIIFTKSLIKYCPMLEVAKIWFVDGYLEIVEELLISCIHLKKLTIEYKSNTGYWNSAEANPLFNILVNNNETKNLNEIFFVGSLNVTSEDLINFLENWRGKKKLYIAFDHNSNLTKHWNIFENFKSEGVLKGWKILKDDYDYDIEEIFEDTHIIESNMYN